MASCRQLRQGMLFIALLAGVVTGTSYVSATTSALSGEGQQIAKVLSVRKVLRTPYFASRYPQIHYYTLYFAVRGAEQTYCGEYETPVLDEIDDVLSSKDKNVEIVLDRKNLTLTTPTGRKIKAHVVTNGC